MTHAAAKSVAAGGMPTGCTQDPQQTDYLRHHKTTTETLKAITKRSVKRVQGVE